MLSRYTQTRVQVSQRMTIGGTEVTPYSRVTTVQLPGLIGRLVWHRPAGVLVTRPDGESTELPIRDVTRLAQIALLALGFLGGLAAWLHLGRGD